MPGLTTALHEPDFRHVLVPLDGSDLAERAMPTARVLAERFEADLSTIAVAGADDADHLRAVASGALGVDIDDPRALVVDEADPAEAIVRHATGLGSCLVCMSTRGRGHLVGALVGSVARSVLQRCPDPIVALGPAADNPGWTPRPRSWPDPLSVPRIVACVDRSKDSEQILPVAAGWALRLGMSMTILTVADDVLPPITQETPGQGRASGTDLNGYIEQQVALWAKTVPEVDGEVVRDPISIASGVEQHLAERPAGLVAVATHARSGMQRARLGATAANIVQRSVAPCLVAMVQAGDHAEAADSSQ